MSQIDDDLLARFHKVPPASIEEIEQAERVLGVRLPADYQGFLLLSNGGEGHAGAMYVQLWPLQQMLVFNENHRPALWLPGLLGIGSDGGGEGLAFDYREQASEPALVLVPFIGGMDPDAVVLCGPTLEEGLRNGPRWRRPPAS